MRKLLLISLILASSLLAACGGGGGSTGGLVPQPGPSVTTPPKTTYSLKISWAGSLGGSTTQSAAYLRRSLNVRTQSASISQPVLVTANGDYSGPGFGNDADVSWVSASPQPSPMPSASWSATDTSVSIAPQASTDNPGSVLVTPVDDKASTGTLTANMDATLGSNAQTTIYKYARLSLECHHSASVSTDNKPAAYSFSGGNAVPAPDPSTADIYVDGPNCYGAFNNQAETQATIHFPAGGALITSYTVFNTIGSSSFANQVTSIPLNNTSAQPAPYALVFSTASGAKVKLYLEGIGNDYPTADLPNTHAEGAVDGPVCVIGSCIDGSN